MKDPSLYTISIASEDWDAKEDHIRDLEAQAAAVRALVNEQAEDDGLWFSAQTAPEAYLQQALRLLHARIEATDAGKAVQAEITELRNSVIQLRERAEKAERERALCEEFDRDWDESEARVRADMRERAAQVAEDCLDLERPEKIPMAIRALPLEGET